ncbi:MAG: SufE family protein [Caldilineaceae bacterium]|nr:SufE family protein [Caldilineaceae bacterium]
MSTEMTTEEKLAALPPALAEIVEDFQAAEPADRLEYLLDFAMGMPDLPERLQSRRDEMEQVHECQTPVFVFTEIVDGGVHFYIDVPRESPTVRGYAAIVAEGLDGVSPDAVLQTPEDIHYLLGLHEAISHQRLRGLHALMSYLKRQVVAALGEGNE